ncbi:MAG: FKBP-type peptidyl-prolyl cis-trans isomerase [Salinibacterium sp.]|nr:FKBP-type peptidyl-prolyl cis-trans isomerase [Salinibacterium sp.]
MQKRFAIVLAAGVLVSVSACTGAPFAGSACTPAFASGSASDLVSAEGPFGADPKATFPTPLIAEETQVSTIEAAEGEPLAAGQIVDFQVTVLDARNGEVLTASSYDPAQPVRRSITPSTDVLGEVTQCATVGSRIATSTSVQSMFGDTDLSEFDLSAEDTLVVVIDIENAFLGRANGADQLARSGFPSISLAPNGQPGFTIPNEPAPTELLITALKLGAGSVVEEGDQVVLQYTGVLWDTRTVFDSSWERGAPATFLAVSSATDPGGIVPGLAEALIGQRVGSQILAVIPPKFGYEPGQAPTTVPDGSTTVFVFDILGIQ